jgi:hypothetical protein
LKKNNFWFLIIFLFSGCSGATQGKSVNQPVSVKKKEHKIELIKSQIDHNQIVREETDKKIADLREQLYNHQIDLIKKKVKIFKKNEKIALTSNGELAANQTDKLFFDERKMLTEIIEESENFSEKAQAVLNDILEIITKLNDTI